MIHVDIPATLREFLERGQAYLDAPDIMKGLELDDASANLMDVAGHHLKDSHLTGRVFAFRQAFREQQGDRMGELFREIEGLIRELQTQA